MMHNLTFTSLEMTVQSICSKCVNMPFRVESKVLMVNPHAFIDYGHTSTVLLTGSRDVLYCLTRWHELICNLIVSVGS